MSVIVFFNYSYWGDNGRGYQENIEEYDNEREAIQDCERHAVHSAIEGTFNVTRVINGEEGLLDRITQAVKDRIASDKIKLEINTLNRFISEDENFLDSVQDQVNLRMDRLVKNRKRLEELK